MLCCLLYQKQAAITTSLSFITFLQLALSIKVCPPAARLERWTDIKCLGLSTHA